MKKAYVKPQIMFEDFSLSVNIAGNCDIKIDTQASGNCGLDFGNLVIFIDDHTGCSSNDGVVVEGDDGSYNGICYHVPSATSDMFNS